MVQHVSPHPFSTWADRGWAPCLKEAQSGDATHLPCCPLPFTLTQGPAPHLPLPSLCWGCVGLEEGAGLRLAVQAGHLILVQLVSVVAPVGQSIPLRLLGQWHWFDSAWETSVRNSLRNVTLEDCWNGKQGASESLWSRPNPVQWRTWKPREWKGLTQGHAAASRELEGAEPTACSPEVQAGSLVAVCGTQSGWLCLPRSPFLPRGEPFFSPGPQTQQLIPELSSTENYRGCKLGHCRGGGRDIRHRLGCGRSVLGAPGRCLRPQLGIKGDFVGGWVGVRPSPPVHFTCLNLTSLSQGKRHSRCQQGARSRLRSLLHFCLLT